jgi:hypothetical protein
MDRIDDLLKRQIEALLAENPQIVVGVQKFLEGESYAIRVVRAIEETHHLTAKLVRLYNWYLRKHSMKPNHQPGEHVKFPGSSILKCLLPEDVRDAAIGDLEELFQVKVQQQGAKRARLWAMKQIACSIIFLRAAQLRRLVSKRKRRPVK